MNMAVVCGAVSSWIWKRVFFRGCQMSWCFATGAGTFHVQETQLSQRDRATHYVTWNVNCCTTIRKIQFKRLAI